MPPLQWKLGVFTTGPPEPSHQRTVAVTVEGGGGAQSPSVSVFFLLDVCCLLGSNTLKSGCLFLFLFFCSPCCVFAGACGLSLAATHRSSCPEARGILVP